jgi:hypothetical protein
LCPIPPKLSSMNNDPPIAIIVMVYPGSLMHHKKNPLHPTSHAQLYTSRLAAQCSTIHGAQE